MFGLFSGLYQTYFAPVNLNVLVVGESGVGKTTILERIKVTQFSTKSSSSMSSGKTTNIVMERPERVPAYAFGLRLSSLQEVQEHSSNSNDIVASPVSQKRLIQSSSAKRQRQQIRSRSPTAPTTATDRKTRTQPVEAYRICPAPMRYRRAAVDDDDDKDDVEEVEQVTASSSASKQQQAPAPPALPIPPLATSSTEVPSSSSPNLSALPIQRPSLPSPNLSALPIQRPSLLLNHPACKNSSNSISLDDDSSSNGAGNDFDPNVFSRSSASMQSVDLSSYELSPPNNNKHKAVNAKPGKPVRRVHSTTVVGGSTGSGAGADTASGGTKQPQHSTTATTTAAAVTSTATASTHSSSSSDSAAAAATCISAPLVGVDSNHSDNYDLKPNHKMLPLQKIRPTMGMNLATVEICGAKCHFQDLSGKFQNVWRSYYGDCDAVIFVFRVQQPPQPEGSNENSNNSNMSESKSGDEEEDDDDESRREEERLSAKAQLALLSQVRGAVADDVPFLILGHLFDQNSNCPQQPGNNAGAAATTTTAAAAPTPCQTDILYSTSALMPHYHNPLQGVFFARAVTGQGIRSALEWLIPLAKRQHQERQQQNLHRYK